MGKLSLFRIHRSRRWFFRLAIWPYGLKFKASECFLFHVSLNLHLLYCIFFSFFFFSFTVDISFLLLRRFSICFIWICCVGFSITYIYILLPYISNCFCLLVISKLLVHYYLNCILLLWIQRVYVIASFLRHCWISIINYICCITLCCIVSESSNTVYIHNETWSNHSRMTFPFN